MSDPNTLAHYFDLDKEVKDLRRKFAALTEDHNALIAAHYARGEELQKALDRVDMLEKGEQSDE